MSESRLDFEAWREDGHPAWAGFVAWTAEANLVRTMAMWRGYRRGFEASLPRGSFPKFGATGKPPGNPGGPPPDIFIADDP